MHVRHYGIFVAYPPTVDLRDQGLGRHLAMFLKGAEGLSDVRFIIVCPSWTKETLEELFESEQVSSEVFEIVAPEKKPYALRLFELLKAYGARPKRQSWMSLLSQRLIKSGENIWNYLTARAVAVYNLPSLIGFLGVFIPILIFLAPLVVLISPIVAIFLCAKWISDLKPHLKTYFHHNRWMRLLQKSSTLLERPESEKWVLRLFDEMQGQEITRMQAKITALTEVSAWYCPTAFWPSFHDIKAPRLMCVPDVVLSDFPVGFSSVGGDRFLRTFETVEKAIREGEHFVTYSETVKWNTLVDRYGVPAANVTVIPHAPNALNRPVEINGFPDTEATSRNFCQTLLRTALQRSTNPGYTSTLQNGDVKFLFYASQFRPNKNVLMLLRAFEHLLRKRYLGHKLILTGNPSLMPEIGRFVIDKRLQNDVIFLHGLSVPELAACYKLADLAVNPTLSEGGCPFTFTEALSVGTPVVMSRIAVAEEILTDPCLQEMTFFYPYDWRDCAKRIEWAVTHRDELLAVQRKTYALLSQRTWADVVREHVLVLDKIAMQVS